MLAKTKIISQLSIPFTLLYLSICLLIIPFYGNAEEVKWLVSPGFEGKELKVVREWEKTWAGKKVDRTNVDQLKDLLPGPIYEVMTDEGKWGDYNFWFEIVPYRTFEPTPGQVEATWKYSPESRFEHERYDAMLVNYKDVAGVPFPQPKTGQEVAWNFNAWSRGDTIKKIGGGFTVNARSTIEKYSGQITHRTFYASRVDKPPLPRITDKKNPRGIRRANVMKMTAPSSMTDFATFYVKYIDMNREDDSWLYWPRFRKIIRLQSDQRDDTVDGTDLINDDEIGWDGRINKNTYKLIGRKKLLLCRHQNPDTFERERGMVMLSGLQRELTNPYVVEVVTNVRGYVYSKQIWYIDPETWVINYKESYDRQGRLWKFYEMSQNMIKGYPEKGQIAIQQGSAYVDLIRRHGSPGTEKSVVCGLDIPLSEYSLRALEKRGY